MNWPCKPCHVCVSALVGEKGTENTQKEKPQLTQQGASTQTQNLKESGFKFYQAPPNSISILPSIPGNSSAS